MRSLQGNFVPLALLLISSPLLSCCSSASVDEARAVSVSRHRPHQAEFSIPVHQLEDATFRLRVTSQNASAAAPVLVSLQHRESIESWTVATPIATVARTLCPPLSFRRKVRMGTISEEADWNQPELLTVIITTQSASPVLLEYCGQLMTDFTLAAGSSVSFVVESPASPQLLAIRLPPASSRVMARLAFRAWPGSRCALVQLREPLCPQLDTDSRIISSQTLIGSGHLLATGASSGGARNGSENLTLTYYLTVRTFPDGGSECSAATGRNFGSGNDLRSQNFSLTVELLSAHSAGLPMALAAGCLLLLLLLAPVCAHICWKAAPAPGAVDGSKTKTLPEANYELGPIDTVDTSLQNRCTCQPLPEGVASLDDVISDTVDAADRRRQTRYCVHAAVAAVFFCLPALQLVLSRQRLLHESGNQDICYYNFACSLPVAVLGHVVYASNSVFSNLGYAILGVAFLTCVLVHRRSMKQRRALSRWQQQRLQRSTEDSTSTTAGAKFGVPHSHGLHFASGLCMCVEGLLSAGYHLCPSAESFQFDTAFMLVLASLLALLVVAKRRPELRPPAHWGCLAIACLLLLNTLGSSRSEPQIRAGVFAATGLLLLAPPAAVVINRIVRLRRRCRAGIVESAYGCLWLAESAAAFGAAYFAGRGSEPLMSASYSMLLLACLLINTACYLAFYLVKKLQSLARTPRCQLHRPGGATCAAAAASAFCLTAALAAWALALWQFGQAPTDWKLSPAESRSGRNRPCVALGFFDAHDLWHFASSVAIFFSFLFLLTIDDDVADVPRDRLQVF